MKPMKNILKSVIDLAETLFITGIIDTDFWQELIISIVVVIFNFLIIPLIKALFAKLREKGADIPDPKDVSKDDFKDDEKKEEK